MTAGREVVERPTPGAGSRHDREQVGSSTTVPNTTSRRLAPIGLTLLLAASLALYTPWRRAPYEPTDFSEFLPFVLGAQSFADRFAALFQNFVLDQGRFVPLSLAWVDAGWSLFGWNAAGWQWLVWTLMSVVTVWTYALLRRLGADAAGALAGATLLVVGTSAAPLWTHVHYSELPSILFLLGALTAAIGYRSAPRWRLRAALVTACVAGTLLTKETMVATIPFLFAVAVAHVEGAHFARPRITRRAIVLGAALAVLCAGTVVAALTFRARASSGAYGTMYGGGGLSPVALAHNVYGMFMPVRLSLRAPWEMLLFIGVVAAGWTLLPLARADRRGLLLALAVALLLPLGGALVYAPWPLPSHRYAAPFLFGPALLLALAVTGLRHAPRLRRLVGGGIVAVLVVTGGVRAHSGTRAFFVERELWHELTMEVHRRFPADIGDVAVASHVAPWHALLITENVRALHSGAAVPSMRAVGCDTLAARLARGGGPAVSIGTHCADAHAAAPPPRLLVAEYLPPLVFSRIVPPIREEARLWGGRDTSGTPSSGAGRR